MQTVRLSRVRRALIYGRCKISKYRVFPHLLQETQHSKCTDPRDRIFALLSLLSPHDPVVAIEPDYKKDVSEVYARSFSAIAGKRDVSD